MPDAILHAFNWPFPRIAERAAAIAACGYGAVLLPPPLYSDEYGPLWWQRYQPKDYRIIRSHLGRKADFVAALAALHAAGLRVYVDVVFNHMANEKAARRDFHHFPGEAELKRYENEREAFEADRLYGDLDVGLFSAWDFHQNDNIVNWNDLYESQERSLSGLPDLELNDWVISQQRLCLAALNELGVDGYRIDAIKHLPLEHLRAVFCTSAMEGKFVFGESLTAGEFEESLFLWPLVDATSISYYDFALYDTVRRVFSPQGSLRELVDPAAFRQALPWNRAITFSITHDIPNNEGFRWQLLDRQDEFLANAYILGRDGGLPLLFSDHNESAMLCEADRDRWNEAWNRPDMVAFLQFHNAVTGLPQHSLFEGDGQFVFARGAQGIVAINKCGEEALLSLPAEGLSRGVWRCALSGAELNIAGADTFEMRIPPRQALLLLWSGD